MNKLSIVYDVRQWSTPSFLEAGGAIRGSFHAGGKYEYNGFDCRHAKSPMTFFSGSTFHDPCPSVLNPLN